jgi:hypothetical protein
VRVDEARVAEAERILKARTFVDPALRRADHQRAGEAARGVDPGGRSPFLLDATPRAVMVFPFERVGIRRPECGGLNERV